MIPAAVRYHRASSLEDALEALGEPEARALAGGQSLLAVMKLRVARPSVLVDIGRLPLRGVESTDDELRMGALTTWDELAGSPELARPALAAVSECAAGIGDLQVRNHGTIGGSLAHADPSSDIPAPLVALGAQAVLQSRAGTRTLGLSDFFAGAFLTALEPGELVTEIVLTQPPSGSGSAYCSAEHPASGFALVGAAAAVRGDDVQSVALTGVADRPVGVNPDDLESTLVALEVFGDDFASADYRRHLALVLARRALETADRRAEEDTRWQA